MELSVDATAPAAGRVLVVDDEKAMTGMIAPCLARAGRTVVQAHTGPGALAAARAELPDVVVLGLGLPGPDGLEVCRRIRASSECCVLMLTARGDEVDNLAGLGVGADDYITKLFSVRGLVARVQAVVRRPRAGVPAARPGVPLVFGDLEVDVPGCQVRVAGETVALTRTEFDLLAALAVRPHEALSPRRLIDVVRDPAWVGDEHIVDVPIGHVRRKRGDDPAHPRWIDTVRGTGYRMVAP